MGDTSKAGAAPQRAPRAVSLKDPHCALGGDDPIPSWARQTAPILQAETKHLYKQQRGIMWQIL